MVRVEKEIMRETKGRIARRRKGSNVEVWSLGERDGKGINR
jgi:hypothetical protein